MYSGFASSRASNTDLKGCKMFRHPRDGGIGDTFGGKPTPEVTNDVAELRFFLKASGYRQK